MDFSKVLTQLRLELDHLDAAIRSLEHLQQKLDRRSYRAGAGATAERRLAEILAKQTKTATGRRRGQV